MRTEQIKVRKLFYNRISESKAFELFVPCWAVVQNTAILDAFSKLSKKSKT